MCSSVGGGGGVGGGMNGGWGKAGGACEEGAEVTKGECAMHPSYVEFMKNTCKHLTLPAPLFPFFFFDMRIMYSLFLPLNSKQATCVGDQ